MRYQILGVLALVAAASACDTSVLGPERFRQPDRRLDPQPTQLLDGRWRAVQWTVVDADQNSVDVQALGGTLDLEVVAGQSRGLLLIPRGVPGFAESQADLNGVVLALGQTATFQLVNPSFVGRATWTFGERHLAIVRYVENGVAVSVMLQRE